MSVPFCVVFPLRVTQELISENHSPKVVPNVSSEHCSPTVLNSTNWEELLFLKVFCFANFIFEIILKWLHLSLSFPPSKPSHTRSLLSFKFMRELSFFIDYCFMPLCVSINISILKYNLYAYVVLNIMCSAYIMLFACISPELIVWCRIINWCALSWTVSSTLSIPYSPVVLFARLRPPRLSSVHYSMSIVVIVVQLVFRQSCSDVSGKASDITRRRSLTTDAPILWFWPSFCPVFSHVYWALDVGIVL